MKKEEKTFRVITIGRFKNVPSDTWLATIKHAKSFCKKIGVDADVYERQNGVMVKIFFFRENRFLGIRKEKKKATLHGTTPVVMKTFQVDESAWVSTNIPIARR